ncbi:MAG: aromatic ring-hydroxylating dioxygenase subunit alpha [Candidatus Sericytochromatia bacterium]|nr:aromatic ring-hydroxylating dioxygenase subunit alpha [Candidatus Sericytochromatia bacterium]
MTPELQLALLDRLLAHRAAGPADMAAAERIVPAHLYQSADQFGREYQALFRSLPLVLAPSSELPRPGDYLTCDDYGTPLLITRDADGAVHVFENRCRHRGARLVSAGQGRDRHAFACPYHGWTYGNTGDLRHVTHGECFADTDTATHGLVRLPAQERFGLIWAVLDPAGRIDVDAYLGAMAPEIAELDLERHVTLPPYERPFAGNWKLYTENFLESYHVHHAHSALVTGVRDDGILVDQVGPHTRFIGPRHTIDQLPKVDRKRWRLRPCAYFTYFIFPNTQLSVDPDRLMWQRVYPGRVNETRIVQTLLVPELAQGGQWPDIWALSRSRDVAALEEDMRIVDTITEGLETGLLPGFRFGLREPGIIAFHETINRFLAAAALAGGPP